MESNSSERALNIMVLSVVVFTMFGMPASSNSTVSLPMITRFHQVVIADDGATVAPAATAKALEGGQIGRITGHYIYKA